MKPVMTMWFLLGVAHAGQCLAVSDHATVVVNSAIVHNVIYKLLPLTGHINQSAAAHTFSIQDVQYCGADHVGDTARALALIFDGAATTALQVPLLNRDDCKGSTATLAARLKNEKAASPAIAATLTLIARAGSLDIDGASYQAVGNSSQSVNDLVQALSGGNGSLATVPLRNVQFTVTDGVTINANAIINFDRQSAEIDLYPQGATSYGPPPISIDQLDSSINTRVWLPYGVLNTILSHELANIVIPVFKDGQLDVKLTSPVMSGRTNEFDITGRVSESHHNLSFAIATTWTGTDLGLSAVTVTAIQATCSAGDTECIGNNSIATALAPDIQKILIKRYEHALFRPTAFMHPLPITLLGIKLDAHLRTMAAQATTDSIVLDENIALEKRQ